MSVRIYFPTDDYIDYDTVNYTEPTAREHPVLYIGSSYCCFKPEVSEWLADRDISYQYGYAGDYYIEFDNKQDATLFTLRWT